MRAQQHLNAILQGQGRSQYNRTQIRLQKSDRSLSEKHISILAHRHAVCFFLPFKTVAVDVLASTSPDAFTAAPLTTRGTTPGGQRKSVPARDWATDMIQYHCGRSERSVPAYPCLSKNEHGWSRCECSWCSSEQGTHSRAGIHSG